MLPYPKHNLRRFATLGLPWDIKQQTLNTAKRRIATTSTKAFPQANFKIFGISPRLGQLGVLMGISNMLLCCLNPY